MKRKLGRLAACIIVLVGIWHASGYFLSSVFVLKYKARQSGVSSALQDLANLEQSYRQKNGTYTGPNPDAPLAPGRLTKSADSQGNCSVENVLAFTPDRSLCGYDFTVVSALKDSFKIVAEELCRKGTRTIARSICAMDRWTVTEGGVTHEFDAATRDCMQLGNDFPTCSPEND